jgi:phosphoglycerol transferase MdoB-like AlkP superfamily enzyme
MNKLSKTIRSLLKLYKTLMIMVIALIILGLILIFGCLGLFLIFDGQDLPTLFRNPSLYLVFLPALIWCWIQLKVITNTDLTLKAVENLDKIKRSDYLKLVIKYLKISFILDIIFLVGTSFVDWDSLTTEKAEKEFALYNNEGIHTALEFLTPNTYGVSTVFIILLLSLLLKSWDESTVLETELDGVV